MGGPRLGIWAAFGGFAAALAGVIWLLSGFTTPVHHPVEASSLIAHRGAPGPRGPKGPAGPFNGGLALAKESSASAPGGFQAVTSNGDLPRTSQSLPIDWGAMVRAPIRWVGPHTKGGNVASTGRPMVARHCVWYITGERRPARRTCSTFCDSFSSEGITVGLVRPSPATHGLCCFSLRPFGLARGGRCAR